MHKFLLRFHWSLGGLIDNIPELVQVMAWCRPGDKPLPAPMMVSLLTHIYVTRPQWVNRIHWRHWISMTHLRYTIDRTLYMTHWLCDKFASWLLFKRGTYVTLPCKANNTSHEPHYRDVTMSTIASQITGVSIVCSTVCSGAYQRKHRTSVPLAFCERVTGGFP